MFLFKDKNFEITEYDEAINYIDKTNLNDSYMLLARVNDIYVELKKDQSYKDLYKYVKNIFAPDIVENIETNNDYLKSTINILNKRHSFILIIDIIFEDHVVNIFLSNNLR